MDGKTMLELPFDVLVNIFSFLCERDLGNLIRTCKKLRSLIFYDNTIWRNVSRNRLLICNSMASATDCANWYSRCRISHNWRKGKYRSQILFNYDFYMPWLELHKSQVLLLALGSTVYCYPTERRGLPSFKTTLWSLNVPTVKRYDIRTNDISRFVIRDNIFICGNRDGCVSVYHLNNPRKKPALLRHIVDCHNNGQEEVTAVEGIKTNNSLCVIAGSHRSLELCMWTWSCTDDRYENLQEEMQNMQNCTYKTKSVSEEVGIRCLATNRAKDKIAIGLFGNSQPLLLDLQTCNFQLPVDISKYGVYAIRDILWQNENTLAYVTHSGMLQLFDIRTNQVIYNNMDPFRSTMYCLKSDGDHAIVVGVSEYSRCVLFDVRHSSQHVQIYFTQKKASPIYSLDFTSTKLIAASDRSVSVADFQVSSARRTRDYSYVFEVVNRSV